MFDFCTCDDVERSDLSPNWSISSAFARNFQPVEGGSRPVRLRDLPDALTQADPSGKFLWMAAKKPKVVLPDPEDYPASILPVMGDPAALYVVDISGYLFRAYHALPPMSTSSGEPTHAVRGVASMMMRLIEGREPAQVCVAVDSRGDSKRKELYPEYKANRPPMPEDLEPQVARIMELVDALGMTRLEHPGMEADDIIATLAKKHREKGPVVIVSADKDLLQLVDEDEPGVVMWDTMRQKIFGTKETIEKFGVLPEQVRDLLSLMGDSSDNIPGVPGVGVKTAAKLLAQHKTFEGIYENADQIKGKLGEKIRDNRELADLSRTLVTLFDELELEDVDFTYTGPDSEKLRALFIELEFTSMLQQIGAAPAKTSAATLLETPEAISNFLADARTIGELSMYTLLDGEDPLVARVAGVALSHSEGHSAYIPFANDEAPSRCPDREATLALLRPVLSNSLFPKYAADVKREAIAWGQLGVVLRGACFDVPLASYLYAPERRSHTLSEVVEAELGLSLAPISELERPARGVRRVMSEVPFEELVPLAGQHVDYTLRLARLLRPRMRTENFRELYEGLEIPLARVLADLERTGVKVDSELLQEMSVDVGGQADAIEARAHSIVGRPFNLGSPKQLEGILFDELGLRVIKKTKTGRSTNAQVLDELAAEHPLPALILEHRSLTKLKGTYLDALPAAINAATGRVHTRYNQAVAATGRLSSSNPNLQNIPIRTELGRAIRSAFVPEPGFLMCAADYSQVELRVLAHLSQDEELLDAFTRSEDIHVRTATALFEISEAEVTRKQRNDAKTVNYAVIYGQTQFALAQNLGTTKTEAKRYIDAFFARYQGVARFMDETVQGAKKSGYVTTLYGRRRGLADLRSRNPALRNGAERIARNTPIQGTAADIIKRAMVTMHRALEREGLRSRMILTVHDELVFEVHEEEREVMKALIREHMEGAAELSVPLVVDVGFGPTWREAH